MTITISPIRNNDDALATEERIAELMDAKPGTPDFYELDILSLMLDQYERQQHPLPALNPVAMIEFRMDQMGLSRADLARLAFDGQRSRVTEILSGKRKLNLNMVRRLSKVLKVEPKFLIAEYDLS